MNGPFGWSARFWRRIHPGRNPLARRSDRVEGAMLLVVVLGMLIALPLAVFVGGATYRGQAAISEQQHATRHLVTATLLEAVPVPTPAADNSIVDNGSPGVRARWTAPDGSERTGAIPADPGTPAGKPVPLWLTASGDPAPAPLNSTEITTAGIVVGAFFWLASASVLVAGYWAGRLILDRRRGSQWDHAWATARQKWARF
ncbi:Rv1733c family protein [Amycolatopsis taiwanensis]|nr:hypothetical protein [Amycolatopsis taiwanensis]